MRLSTGVEQGAWQDRVSGGTDEQMTNFTPLCITRRSTRTSLTTLTESIAATTETPSCQTTQHLNTLRLCRSMCGEALLRRKRHSFPPAAMPPILQTGGIAASFFLQLNGKAKPFRTSMGKAQIQNLSSTRSFRCGIRFGRRIRFIRSLMNGERLIL